MRKDTIMKTTASRCVYVRPLITGVVPAAIVLQEATPAPDAPVRPEPGEEALSKKIEFDIDIDIWNDWEEEEGDEEASW